MRFIHGLETPSAAWVLAPPYYREGSSCEREEEKRKWAKISWLIFHLDSLSATVIVQSSPWAGCCDWYNACPDLWKQYLQGEADQTVRWSPIPVALQLLIGIMKAVREWWEDGQLNMRLFTERLWNSFKGFKKDWWTRNTGEEYTFNVGMGSHCRERVCVISCT